MEDVALAGEEKIWVKPNPDPRICKTHFDFTNLDPTKLYGAPDPEDLSRPVGYILSESEIEPDEEACSLRVLDFPKDKDLEELQRRFGYASCLRRDVERHPETGNILVIFNSRSDMIYAFSEMDVRNGYIDGVTTRLEMVKHLTPAAPDQ